MTKSAFPELNRALASLSTVLSVVRQTDPEMPAQTLSALVYIAQHPGCSPINIEEHLNVTSGTATRITARLSDYETNRTQPMGLIVSEVNPTDRRLRMLYLSQKGQAFLSRIARAME